MRSEGYSSWVCLSVCLSVKSQLTSRMNNQAIKSMNTYWHMNVKKFVGIFPKRLRSGVMPQNTSETNLSAYPRTDSTTRRATTRGVANFCARALACAEGLHFSAFHWVS